MSKKKKLPTARSRHSNDDKAKVHKSRRRSAGESPTSGAQTPPTSDDRGSAPKDLDNNSNVATKSLSEPHDPLAQEPQFVVVGIGASAGGLEVLGHILGGLAPDSGAAYIIVQHLSPDHDSALPQLLGPKCSIPIVEARDGMELEPNKVYSRPANSEIGISGHTIRLGRRAEGRAAHTPINRFFRSLAEEPSIRPVGIILSGTASDGASGIRDIKAAGGIAIAQDPATARFDMMPRAAIGTGLVDLVLKPQAIVEELNQITKHPAMRETHPQRREGNGEITPEQFQQVFDLLRRRTGVDFSQYKSPTIRRRLQRRIALHKLDGMKNYLQRLQEDPHEAVNLHNDLLIQVTSFFREPKAFEALRRMVFPELLRNRSSDDPIRVWVPGCSTGEEAYSVAIELLDFLAEQSSTIPLQIFATDVSEPAIDRARSCAYTDTIEDEVHETRLRRYFVRSNDGYRVAKSVRDVCVFARQDLTRDPPFSRMDLIACRNVMIYLGTKLQRRLLTVFHYALKSTGTLLLGASETVAQAPELFESMDKNIRLFRKKAVDREPHMAFQDSFQPPATSKASRVQEGRGRARKTLLDEANRIMLESYSPCGVIIDEHLQIVHFHGRTGMFLEPAPGDASLDVLRMARQGLLYGLRGAIHGARKSQSVARNEGLTVSFDGKAYDVSIEVVPMPSDAGMHYLVLFEHRPVKDSAAKEPAVSKKRSRAAGKPGEEDQVVKRLQQELDSSREALESIIQDLEAANEALQSANEEILSGNEELQSANEELDTAREELQSTNEELNTLNEELRARNDDLSQANSDLLNLLSNVQIAIVIVSRDLRVRRFTPVAEHLLNLLPNDLGRPIGHIKPNIDCPDLERRIARVVDEVATDEYEVRDRDGRWYSLRIRPYKDTENRIDGAIIALHDIDTVKMHEIMMSQSLNYAEAIIETTSQPLLVLTDALAVQSANPAFREQFQVSEGETKGVRIYDLGNGQWNIPKLRELLERILPEDEAIEGFEVDHNFRGLGRRTMRLNARKLKPTGEKELILLAIDDVTKGRVGA